MKRPYEKPTLTDLSLPTARAGWLPGGGKASPQGICHDGFAVGDPTNGGCSAGKGPTQPGSCFSGTSDSGTGNTCFTGFGK